MKAAVVSYSLTGNNDALARSVAKEFACDHIRITEPKKKSVGSIAIDMILGRTPRVAPVPDSLKGYDSVLVFGPVWMGSAASPLRAYLNHLKANPCRYTFVSISGGANGQNPKLGEDLKKRTGRKPAAVIDLHIADLLPSDRKPTIKDTSAYRLCGEDIQKCTNAVKKELEKSGFFA